MAIFPAQVVRPKGLEPLTFCYGKSRSVACHRLANLGTELLKRFPAVVNAGR